MLNSVRLYIYIIVIIMKQSSIQLAKVKAVYLKKKNNKVSCAGFWNFIFL